MKFNDLNDYQKATEIDFEDLEPIEKASKLESMLGAGDIVMFDFLGAGAAHFSMYDGEKFYENDGDLGVIASSVKDTVIRKDIYEPDLLFKYKGKKERLEIVFKRAEMLLGKQHDHEEYNCEDFILDILGCPLVSASYNRRVTLLRGFGLGIVFSVLVGFSYYLWKRNTTS